MAELPLSRISAGGDARQGPGGNSRGSLAAILPPKQRALTSLSGSAGEPDVSGPLPGITTEIDPAELTLGERLGSGTYGDVYEGLCRGQSVAVKILRVKKMDEDALSRLRAEVAIMSKLSHPNIIRYMGASTVDVNKVCIVTELMSADLQVVIEAPFSEVSFMARIHMARDAAKGMLWLHRSNPMIIHRDLKPGNLLIDESLRVVVADFGLSDQLKRNSQTYDEAGYKGTPHYTAPEVLRGIFFDQSVDVYSFSLVVWELFTRKRLFRDLDWASWSLAELRQRLCFEGYRPPLPAEGEANWTPRLRGLLTRMWAEKPAERDSFDQILKELDEAALEHAVADSEGRAVWRTAFPSGEDTANWTTLQNALGKQLYPEREWDALHSVVAHVESKRSSLPLRRGGVVTLEQWGRVLAWLAPGPLHTLGARALVLVMQRWFHGEISVGSAESLLTSHDTGTYLVRFSSVIPGGYCLSHVDEEGEVHHVRIFHTPLGNELYFIDKENYESLEAAVTHLVVTLGLTRPCPGSLFSSFWPPRSPRLSTGEERERNRNASPYRP